MRKSWRFWRNEGGNNFYDGMITCSTLSGKAVCRLVWMIPGTEDLKPYITAKDKQKKWLFGTVGMAVIAAVLAAIMTDFIH